MNSQIKKALVNTIKHVQKSYNKNKNEFLIILFTTINGMFFMISSGDFLYLFRA